MHVQNWTVLRSSIGINSSPTLLREAALLGGRSELPTGGFSETYMYSRLLRSLSAAPGVTGESHGGSSLPGWGQLEWQ
jgi:hypothetical protein